MADFETSKRLTDGAKHSATSIDGQIERMIRSLQQTRQTSYHANRQEDLDDLARELESLTEDLASITEEAKNLADEDDNEVETCDECDAEIDDDGECAHESWCSEYDDEEAEESEADVLAENMSRIEGDDFWNN